MLCFAHINISTDIMDKYAKTAVGLCRLAVMGEEADTDIGNIGHVRWRLCLCLLLAWILVALFVCKGIKSSGKVS